MESGEWRAVGRCRERDRAQRTRSAVVKNPRLLEGSGSIKCLFVHLLGALERPLGGKGREKRRKGQRQLLQERAGLKRRARPQECSFLCKPSGDRFILRKYKNKNMFKIETHKAHKLGNNY